MCDICLSSPCLSRCPNNDPLIAFTCNECRDDIYPGEEYYEFDGENICENCIWDYLKQFKREAEEYKPDYDDRD